ncbi:MAG: hypothetical protein ACE5HE_15280, partial [Phycisphaerae bacterium]
GVGAERGVVGLAGQQPIENVLGVGPDIQIVAHRAADKGKEVGGTVARGYAADEQPDGMTFSRNDTVSYRAVVWIA